MTAPRNVGPDEPGAPPQDPLARSGKARSEWIAELAARLASIESRDRAAPGGSTPGARIPGDNTSETASAGTVTTEAASTRTASAEAVSAGTVTAGTVSAGTVSAGTGSRAGSRRSAAGVPPVPIGSSGSTGAGRPEHRRDDDPGGHPEDAPGDPEAVAKALCLRLLTGAARPRAGLATALRRRGIPDDVADRVLGRLTEVGLIDDQAYAEAFVATKHRERALGVSALRTELRRKGVDDETVAVAVQAVDQDAERDRARALIARRVDAAMANGAPTARRRLVGLLARRGYPAELACQVVDEVLADYGAEGPAAWPE